MVANPLGLSGPLVVSNTMLRDGSPGGSRGDGGVGVGNIHPWRR